MARSFPVLKLSHKIKNIITFAQSVATSMTNNPSFPSPTPTLATFEADIAALSKAETAVLSRVKGAAENRNAALAVVHGHLKSLQSYVEGVANAANPNNAAAIIESAGMAVRKVTLHDKPALSVKQGPVSGTVRLVAKAAASRAAYDWQYSTDAKTWTTLPQTLQAKTKVIGLTAGTVYSFRVQALVRTGEENWSQVVSMLVS
jgi:HWE histidine kinase